MAQFRLQPLQGPRPSEALAVLDIWLVIACTPGRRKNAENLGNTVQQSILRQ